MKITKYRDGSISIKLTKTEAEALTFEIAMTDNAWSRSKWLQKTFDNPKLAPLHQLHTGIHQVWGTLKESDK